MTPADRLAWFTAQAERQRADLARVMDAGEPVRQLMHRQEQRAQRLAEAVRQITAPMEKVREVMEGVAVTITPPAAVAAARGGRAVVAQAMERARAALAQMRKAITRRTRHALTLLLQARRPRAAFVPPPRPAPDSREGPPGVAARSLALVSSLVDAPCAPPSRVHFHDLAARAA